MTSWKRLGFGVLMLYIPFIMCVCLGYSHAEGFIPIGVTGYVFILWAINVHRETKKLDAELAKMLGRQ